ncbi:ribonuclease 8-like [Notamacropus eugenii]|uniref:ribonuclease 8-like n=1 Tax=Notamacropus eugenii TaxID=9315 RepID=UPI003B66CEDB
MGTFQLLLLGVTMFLVTEAIPPGFTRAQWFNEQHVQYPKKNALNENVYCNNEMRRINHYTGVCKSFNSFLHDPLDDIIMTCFQSSIRCKRKKYKNCHYSNRAVNITDCQLVSRVPSCRYSGRSKQSHFVVGCLPPSPGEHSTSPLLPTHLDKTWGQNPYSYLLDF